MERFIANELVSAEGCPSPRSGPALDDLLQDTLRQLFEQLVIPAEGAQARSGREECRSQLRQPQDRVKRPEGKIEGCGVIDVSGQDRLVIPQCGGESGV